MAIVMREICDACAEFDAKETEGRTVVLSIGKQEYAIELCDHHREFYLDPVEQLLVNYGRTDQPKRRRRSRAATAPAEAIQDLQDPGGQVGHSPTPSDGSWCPLCGLETANRQTLSGHLRKVHDSSVTEMVYQDLLPRTARTPLLPDFEPVTCPICNNPFKGLKGFKSHRRAHTDVEWDRVSA